MKRALHSSWLLAVVLSACGGSSNETPAPAAPPELVALADLPVVRRVQDPLESSAVDVAIGTTAITVAGQRAAVLTNGGFGSGTTAERVSGAVASAVGSQAGKARARVRIHSIVPFGTLLAVLRGLKSAGVEKVGFVVRKPMSTETGVLAPAAFDVRDPSSEPVRFEPPYQRDWDDFVRTWDESYTRCAVETGFQCTGVADDAALGGLVEIGLFTRQEAFVIDVRRFGTGDPPPPILPLLPPQNDGSATKKPGREERMPPASRASFYFRRTAANVRPDSPLALTIRPLCQGAPCGVRLSSDLVTSAAQVLGFLGATFPDGTPAPSVIFDSSPR